MIRKTAYKSLLLTLMISMSCIKHHCKSHQTVWWYSDSSALIILMNLEHGFFYSSLCLWFHFHIQNFLLCYWDLFSLLMDYSLLCPLLLLTLQKDKQCLCSVPFLQSWILVFMQETAFPCISSLEIHWEEKSSRRHQKFPAGQLYIPHGSTWAVAIYCNSFLGRILSRSLIISPLRVDQKRRTSQYCLLNYVFCV